MKKIFKEFETLYKKIKCIYENIIACEKKYQENEKLIQEQINDNISNNNLKIKEYEKTLKLLTAYKELALTKNINENLNAYICSKPVDINLLAKLAVLSNDSVINNYAKQLYLEASCQIEYVKEQIKEINGKANLQQEYNEFNEKNLQEYIQNIQMFKNEISKLLIENTNKNIIKNLKEIVKYYSNYEVCENNNFYFRNEISIGYNSLIINEDDIKIPILWDFEKDKKLFIEYNNKSENVLLGGLRQLIYNIIKHYSNDFDEIILFDPVRLDNSVLGKLEPLVYNENQILSYVPKTLNEISSKLKEIINYYSNNNDIHNKKLIILHNFPNEYSSESIGFITKLCANISFYNVNVIITNNLDFKNKITLDTLNFIKLNSKLINVEDNLKFNIFVDEIKEYLLFDWYAEPNYIEEEILNKKSKELFNIYEKLFNIDAELIYDKGDRMLSHIPYGIDAEGNLLFLDFNHHNFATFICGASRSGKSTLLHTLITGLIRQKHPDDVEIWLIDFKMTEFSRYINNLPPHVRYIILDESQELIYDIIDRLTEIMMKRQNILKGKWDKVIDIPKTKYMPSIFIIIDEFSVMSQVIADSINDGKDNYSLKLQTLLAKGAALGLHFIFSSQGFTSGTRGLSDFSKKQIQQRIALKTEYHEIKSTLDLLSSSENDKVKMEQLKPHYALVKNEVPNSYGDYLQLAYVLYIENKNKIHDFIKRINETYKPSNIFEYDNEKVYIDKQAMIIDGNNYKTFEQDIHEKQKIIKQLSNENEINLFIGEPKRMVIERPIKLINSFQENIITFGSFNEGNAVISLNVSMIKSLLMQGKQPKIVCNSNNKIVKQIKEIVGNDKIKTINDLEKICSFIKEIKEKIDKRIYSNEVNILFDLDLIFSELQFARKNDNQMFKTDNNYSKRKDGEDDLLTKLKKAQAGIYLEEESEILEDNQIELDVYDAREDLKTILMLGPKFGYHFVVYNNTISELKQTKISIDLFKHMIFFRTPRYEVSDLVGLGESRIISELSNEIFRYTNKLESLNFKPYIYKGLIIGGFKMSDNGIIENMEEEYLL